MKYLKSVLKCLGYGAIVIVVLLFFTILLYWEDLSDELVDVSTSQYPELNQAKKLYKQERYSKALLEFKKYADENNPEAQYRLGLMYFYGNGTNVETELSYKYLKKAVENNYALAINLYSFMYSESGYAPERDKREEMRLEKKFLKNLQDIVWLSNEGDVFASLTLGQAYFMDFESNIDFYNPGIAEKYIIKEHNKSK